MGIVRVRLPAHKLTLAIYTGRISREALLDYYREVNPEDPASAAASITYIDPDADMSGLDLAAFTELKRILAPKVKVLAQTPGFHCIIVCNSAQCDAIVRFWRAYLVRDSSYATPPIFFPDVLQACKWLELPQSACDAAEAAIRAQRAEPVRTRQTCSDDHF